MPAWLKNFGAFAVWSFIILILFLIPGRFIPPIPDFYHLFKPDKIVHLVLFGVYTYLLMQSLRKQYGTGFLRYIGTIIALLAGIFYGAITEVLQYVLAINRSGNFYDFIANSVGSLIGIGIFLIVLAKNNAKTNTD
ncbi:MAG: VanZ family protein [Bacteroidales bacterium]